MCDRQESKAEGLLRMASVPASGYAFIRGVSFRCAASLARRWTEENAKNKVVVWALNALSRNAGRQLRYALVETSARA